MDHKIGFVGLLALPGLALACGVDPAPPDHSRHALEGTCSSDGDCPSEQEGPPLVVAADHVGMSPFAPVDKSDTAFVVDQDAGLDTGCRFNNSGALIFHIPVDRVVGDVAELKARGLISAFATLSLPAFDVDYESGERDRLSFNGHVVSEEFLTGTNDEWKLNAFQIPIEWVQFPADPGPNGVVAPIQNTIRIDIDVLNTVPTWCTSIDWAVLELDVVRPVVMVHGLFTDSSIWDDVWVPELTRRGMLVDPGPSMGDIGEIPANALAIRAAVERALQRWGVDRVNLVAHSKGGIDARHYAELDDTVDQLVQIGAPNAGTPLVDAIQSGQLELDGQGGSPNLNKLAGPEGLQLTQHYMQSIYNATHGANPKVRYTAVAGEYDPGCPELGGRCQPREQMFLSIAGAGDTIVPVTSVHSLDYTTNAIFRTTGADKHATHGCFLSGPSTMCLFRSPALFTVASAPLLQFGRPASASSAGFGSDTEAASVPLPGYVRTATRGGELSAGITARHEVLVDEQQPLFFTVMYPAGEILVELVAPSGRRIDPAEAEHDGGIHYDAGATIGGNVVVYALDVPEIGAWTVEVTTLAAPPEPAHYAIHAWIEAPAIRITATVDREALARGEAFDIYSAVRQGEAPVLGASVRTRVARPDGNHFGVELHDDGAGPDLQAGDGVYSGRFAETSVSGLYHLSVGAHGTTSAGVSFSREELAVITVSESRSRFTGAFHDFGRDLDDDGYFDELIVAVDLDLDSAGEYRLFAVLTDALGNEYQARARDTLDAGLATMELVFSGESIFQARIDGPFTLSRLALMEVGGSFELPVATGRDVHVTQAYAYSVFEHDPILLTGHGGSAGIDLDEDDLFDYLLVTLGVEVEHAGFYQWSARLVDPHGAEIDFRGGSAELSPGFHYMTLVFDGNRIGAHGVDGPYSIRSLLMFGGGEHLVASGQVAETAALAASEFAGFVWTCPPGPSVWDACSLDCPCTEGVGDCDDDHDCATGLRCVDNVGLEYGYDDPDLDVCTAACPTTNVGSSDFCSLECPCTEGQGDCDDNHDCAAGLHCAKNVGLEHGYEDPDMDVCTASCPTNVGSSEFCSTDCPCAAGEGDCDADDECEAGLRCARDVGAAYGLDPDTDVCEP